MSGGHVLHVLSELGVPTEGFVGDAILAAQQASWEPYVATLRGSRAAEFIAADRVYRAPMPRARSRALARALYRRPHTSAAKVAAVATAVAPRARSWEIELVHAHFGWAAPYAAALARRLGVPLLVTFYGTDASAPPTPARWRRQRYPPAREVGPYGDVFDSATRVLAVSEFIARRLRGLGYDGPIDLARPAIALERFPLYDAPRPGPPRILCVARLIPVKGLDVLLRAIGDVLVEHPDATLEVIGDGAERSRLEQLARTLGVHERVTFSGARDRAEVLDALRRAHVVAVPSRAMPNGQEEASSVVFKEALAVGTPVVASDSGGLSETCPPSRRADLVASGDAPALARALSRTLAWGLAASPSAWREHARASRAWVADRYSHAVLSAALADSYSAALEASKARDREVKLHAIG